jgi:hypothetical protein
MTAITTHEEGTTDSTLVSLLEERVRLLEQLVSLKDQRITVLEECVCLGAARVQDLETLLPPPAPVCTSCTTTTVAKHGDFCKQCREAYA